MCNDLHIGVNRMNLKTVTTPLSIFDVGHIQMFSSV